MATIAPDTGASSWTPKNPFAQTVSDAGFAYDASQDIIVSRTDAWQYGAGFCRLYDESSPVSIQAIIDCEPIRFAHGGKEWMIELWKGQYGPETGAEVGIYNRAAASTASRVISTAFSIVFPLAAPVAQALGHAVDWYPAAPKADWLEISLTLKKNGTALFQRGPERHWWLTGFRWGVLSEPGDLVAEIEITIPDHGLRDAFEHALPKQHARLTPTRKNSVAFRFAGTTTPQPALRTSMHDTVMQSNQKLVTEYLAAKQRLQVKTNDPNELGDKAGAADALQSVVGYFTEVHACKAKWDKVWH
jgi:Domain of unknown function (DUF4474)